MRFASKRYKNFLSKKLETNHSIPGFTKTWQPMYTVKFTTGVDSWSLPRRIHWQWFASPHELEKLFAELELSDE